MEERKIYRIIDIHRLLFLISCISLASTSIEDSLKGIRRHGIGTTPMHKVLLTQKGYIQFLRWELPVPELEEFTFCLWVQSNNLSLPHSIFSYSKDEKDRLTRAWISSYGRSIHLEISGMSIFEQPTNIKEDRWYHVCQSWENRAGRYALWLDGRILTQGSSKETINHRIPKGGDIVLGQEYTDFDKGLEEGIEGAVLGFNLLLASAFSPPIGYYQETPLDPIPGLSALDFAMGLFFPARIPKRFSKDEASPEVRMPHATQSAVSSGVQAADHVDWALRIPTGRRNVPNPPESSWRFAEEPGEGLYWPAGSRYRRGAIAKREIGGGNWIEQPLGLQLVQLSYVHCEIGRGSPFIGGPLMLISWSRTPVRVFGGATVKNVAGTCGNF
ncbi:hypothetical protein KM043_012977 [Ampulex compressa]|nr:hypothetical protein KM043_012977 [Ampulex compressa]